MPLKKITFLFFFFLHFLGFCQSKHKLDSLYTLLKKNPTPDTNLAKIYYVTAAELRRVNPDSSKLFADRALSISTKLNFKEGIANAYHLIGLYYTLKTNYTDALKHYEMSKKVREDIRDIKGIANSQNNIGIVYSQQGLYDKAFLNYKSALKLQEQVHDTAGMASTFNYIATAYYYLSDYEQALKNYLAALKIHEKTNNYNGLAQVYNNMGNVYHILDNRDKALENYRMALDIEKKMGDKFLMASANFNLGDIYKEKKEYDKALTYYLESMKLAKEKSRIDVMAKNLLSIGSIYEIKKDFIGALKNYTEALKMNEKLENRREMANSLIYLANCQQQLGQIGKSQQSLERALELAKGLKAKFVISLAYESFYKLYKLKKDFKKSYEYMALFSNLRDTLFGEEKNKNIAEMQTRFDTDKKEKEIILLTKNKNIEELQSSEQQANIKKQKVTIYSSLGGITLALTLVFFVLRGNIQKKKANFLLEEKNEDISAQKKILEEKNILITDSIEYAKSIQDAILPAEKTIYNLFSDSFILFKPKDVVSGDFYWLSPAGGDVRYGRTGEDISSEGVLLAVIDCVGHGVPGAFMALHSYNLLERITKKNKNLRPSEILDELNKKVIETLNQQNPKGNSKTSSVKYGMDLSMIKIFPASPDGKTKVEFSGARNSLVVVGKEIIEVKADRMYVGGALGNFTNHSIVVEKGSMVYMFTDGYADQKGGSEGKKFFAGSLLNLLKDIALLPAVEQKNILEKTNNEWKGNFEQIDDILLVGIRV